MKARFSTEVKSFSKKNFSEKYADIKSEGDTKIIIVLNDKNCVCLV